jgi:hypothetical protein
MERTAKYYAMGLRLGILGKKDIQSWVDTEIRKSDVPSNDFIELAYSANESIQNLYSMLCSIKDESDTYVVLRALLSEVKEEQLASIEFCRRLAECLYRVWVDNDYQAPGDLSLIGFFDDEYALASQEIYGSLEKWHNEFKGFVESFKNVANQ